jgi:hypothetical protein
VFQTALLHIMQYNHQDLANKFVQLIFIKIKYQGNVYQHALKILYQLITMLIQQIIIVFKSALALL